MTDERAILFVAGGALGVVGLALLTYLVLSQPAGAVSLSGTRGYQRQRARLSPGFRLVEPILRLVAAWVAWLPVAGLRRRAGEKLEEAGDYLGLTPDELIALSLLSGAVGTLLVGAAFSHPALMAAGFVVCVMLPVSVVGTVAGSRARQVARQLPSVIELIALCVSAGMDLPGALREVVGVDSAEDDPLRQELRHLLRELDLGHSRRQALESLSRRVHGDGVRDFCASVIQSEEKGNPLKEVLEAQAKILHMRRSFRAEVLASRASVKLVIPLTMLMLTVMLLIGSPLLLRFREGFG